MAKKITEILDSFLREIDEDATTKAHLGSNDNAESAPPTLEQIRIAAETLLNMMKAEKASRQTILYILLGARIVWFLLCAWVIIYLFSRP